MHNSDDFVAVIAILTIFGLPLALAIANRVYSHQERIEMIRRGMVPPIDPRWARRMSRQGFDPSVQQAAPQNGTQYDMMAQFQADRTLRKGITLTMIGFALFIGLFFINPDRPGPWLLGGLIPMFVGIAQIILGLLSGARIGAWGLSAPPQPPPSMPSGSQYTQAPPNGNQRDVSSGAYAWRPGPTPELERPTPPPDVK